MIRRRWTRRDDEALIDAEAGEMGRRMLATYLDVPIDAITVLSVRRLRPCRHWRCRWLRLTRRLTRWSHR